MNKRRLKCALPITAAVVISLLGGASWAATTGSLAGSSSLYDELYPTYAEVCAVSKIEQIGQAAGGMAGHGVMYLKGACRDPRVDYPRLALCEDVGRDPTAPDSGVAISVDQIFSNVNWVAIEDREYFFSGGLGPNDAIDSNALNATVQKAIQSGIFKAVKLNERYRQAYLATNHLKSIYDAEYMANEGVGTDYAISFGRDIYCTRMPLPAIQGKPVLLSAVIGYLNALNDRYHASNDYHWDAFTDNCTHVPHDALAAAGIVNPIATDQIFPISLFNLDVPANEFVSLARLENDPPLDDLSAMGRTDHVADNLLSRNWIPVQPGGLVETFPMHTLRNEEFAKSPGILLLEIPLLQDNVGEFKRVLNTRADTDLIENLRSFEARDQAALDHRHSKAFFYWTGQGFDPHFSEFYDKYYAFVTEQLAKVKGQLAQITASQ